MNDIERALKILAESYAAARHNNDGTDECAKDDCFALPLAIEALQEKAAREHPQPLTLEQLKERTEKPVWIKWLRRKREDGWIVWKKPALGTIFDLDDSEVCYGINFVAYDHEIKE